ncbi:hypothetical protein Forpe1208_v013985 [Fusarium oxysporum f. sp. rapae]|uniref:Uncharacterized protein n=1 Tax=Fusarium oxysporum f. sp. rapae TaxID=485398 RepID=A0A8J5U0V0_FUSOX|nr:hypothetical protein Forpe1208_v013985 [Fusarium oxysporum f. sp. rapae]
MDNNGYGFQHIWIYNSDEERKAYGSLRILEKKVRACQLLVPRDNAKDMKQRLVIDLPPIRGCIRDDGQSKGHKDDFSQLQLQVEALADSCGFK